MKINSVFKALSLLLFPFVSCTTEDGITGGDVVLELISPETMEVSAEGGEVSILYSVTESSYSEVSVQKDQDWITDIDQSDEGVISFQVARNTSALKRYGNITVSCPGADNVLNVEIVQSSGGEDEDLPGDVSNDDFSVEVVNITAESLTAHVTPEVDDMRYITMIRRQDQVEGLDDEALFQYDLKYIEAYSQSSFMPVSEVINLLSAVGEKDIRMIGLEQGTDYCFYVYGITDDAERTTDICRLDFTTDVIEYIDIDFTIDVRLEGLTAYADIAASDPDVPFYFDLEEGAAFRNGDPDEIVSGLIRDLFAEYSSYGFSAEYVIVSLGSFGSDSYVFGNLKPDTEYVIYAAALDYDGMVVSKAACRYFTTDEAGNASGLTVDYIIDDITAYGADIQALPSDKTVKYFWDVVVSGTTAAQVKEMISNTADTYIAQGAASDFNDFMANVLAIRGDNSFKYETLSGSTEYVTYAFGITEDGSYATDIMFGDTFTTLDRRVSDAWVEVSYDRYFDSKEVAAVYPQFPGLDGMAIVPSVVEMNSSAVGYYYTASHGDMTDTQKYPDDLIIGQLIEVGTTEPMPYWLNYGDVTYLAVAYDNEGNYGKLFREKHNLTREGASPVSEFNPSIMSAAGVSPADCAASAHPTIYRTITLETNQTGKQK